MVQTRGDKPVTGDVTADNITATTALAGASVTASTGDVTATAGDVVAGGKVNAATHVEITPTASAPSDNNSLYIDSSDGYKLKLKDNSGNVGGVGGVWEEITRVNSTSATTIVTLPTGYDYFKLLVAHRTNSGGYIYWTITGATTGELTAGYTGNVTNTGSSYNTTYFRGPEGSGFTEFTLPATGDDVDGFFGMSCDTRYHYIIGVPGLSTGERVASLKFTSNGTLSKFNYILMGIPTP